jgi:hypothetical protein
MTRELNWPANAIAVPRPFEGRYRDYLIKFKPQPTPDGRFLALAILSFSFDSVHTLASVAPDVPSFPSEQDAASAAWEAATLWIDNHVILATRATPQCRRTRVSYVRVAR